MDSFRITWLSLTPTLCPEDRSCCWVDKPSMLDRMPTQINIRMDPVFLRELDPRLNFGGCFSHATAKLRNMLLLTFDADFAGIDVPAIGLE